MKALSIRQPWLDAILAGEKRIENRVAWRGSKQRGPILLHAAKGMTRLEYNEAIAFMMEREIKWRPRLPEALERGAIMGRAVVSDVIYNGGLDATGAQHPLAYDRWYMGGFALVLSDVERFDKPIPFRGMLGFFPGPDVLP